MILKVLQLNSQYYEFFDDKEEENDDVIYEDVQINHTATRTTVFIIWLTGSHSCRYHVRALFFLYVHINPFFLCFF